MLRDIEAPIAAYVGNELSLSNTTIEVLDRPGWIRANMINFRFLLQPVEDFYKENLGQNRFGPPLGFQQAARMMLSSQVGVLVGYLARRVLGQDQPEAADRWPRKLDVRTLGTRQCNVPVGSVEHLLHG